MIQIHNSFDAIESYRQDWNHLAGLQQNALLTFEWFSCCARAFHADDSLYLICVVENRNLIAAAPLYRSKHANQDYLLQIIGNRRLYEPTSLLYRDDIALSHLLGGCRSIGYPMMLNRCYQDMPVSRWLSKISWRGILITMAAADSQYLDISGDFASYEEGLSSRRRYDLRRASRKAMEYGEPDYHIGPASHTDIADLLQQAFRIENSSWKNSSGSSIVKNRDLTEFFSDLFEQLVATANGVVGILSINGQPVASHLAIQQFGRLWILKIGYDQAYASCSPGILLTHEMIRYAHSNHLRGFEFLGCSEEWIKLWKPKIRDYGSYLYYPLSYYGIKGFLIDASKILKNRISGRD